MYTRRRSSDYDVDACLYAMNGSPGTRTHKLRFQETHRLPGSGLRGPVGVSEMDKASAGEGGYSKPTTSNN